MNRNVLVVGAGGVASVLVAELAKDKSVNQIVCGTIDLPRARQFINTGDPKTELRFLDASNEAEVAKAAKDFDAIINAGLPDFNEKIMGAALKKGADYQDFCSLLQDWKTPEQLKFHKKFRKEGLVGLINSSAAPGITNLLAREAADSLGSVESIKFRLYEEQNSKRPVYSWSPDVTANEIAAKPLFYRNGKFIFAEPFADPEAFEFPEPIGQQSAINLYGDEISTLPKYIKLKNADFKSCGSDLDLAISFYRQMKDSGKLSGRIGDSADNIGLFSKNATPVPTPQEMRSLVEEGIIESAVFAVAVQATGSLRGKKAQKTISIVFPDIKEITRIRPGATYISYPSGIAAYAFSKIIPKLSEKGVYPPEALGKKERKMVLRELEKRGIKAIYGMPGA